MSRSGDVDIVWGDGEHRFRLAIGQLRELEEKTKIGPPELFDRLLERRWRVDEIRHVIRLGLIGGGMKPEDAVAMVDRHIHDWPWARNVAVAMTVMNAALFGHHEDAVGKEEAGEAPSASASPASTGTARRSGSRRGKSTK